jgi:DNA-binding CsgD family transcriptional regulator/tetratricopeptide (TPR) repeat protein
MVGNASSSATVASRPFAGRVAEQRLLDEVLSASAQGVPTAVLVHGEAGVGKTRLVRQVTEHFRTLGHEVLWGTCVHFGAASVPFAPVVQALDSWALRVEPAVRTAVFEGCDELSILLTSMGMRTSEVPASRLLPVVDRVVQRIVDRQPTVLVIDDLQWADVSSLDALAYLITGFRGQSLALVATIREEDRPVGHPLHGWLADMRRLPGVSDVMLKRFDQDESTQQIAALLGQPPDEGLVADVLARSGGNAYLTELLVRDLQPDARSLPSEPPQALREALLARWHSLSEPARLVTRVLAVGGRPTTFETLSAVAESAVSAQDLPDLVREAVDAGVVQVVGEQTYWFRHPLLAEVLLATLTLPERMPVHAAYAEALGGIAATRSDLAAGLSADLAVHHEGAGQIDQAFAFSILAADFAHDLHASSVEAAHLLRACAVWERVGEQMRGSTEDRIALLLRTSRVGQRAGVLESPELLDQAISLVDRQRQPLLASTLLAERGDRVWQLDDLPSTQVRPELFEAVQLTEPFPDSPERVFALRALVHAELWHVRTPELPAHIWGQVQEAVEVAQRSGSEPAIAKALSCRAQYLFCDHRALEALSDAEASYQLAARTGQVDTMGNAAVWQANALWDLGLVSQFTETMQTRSVELLAAGSSQTGSFIAALAAEALLDTGHWTECRDTLRDPLSSRRVGIAGARVRHGAARLAARRGEAAIAQQHLDRALELVPIDYVGMDGGETLLELLVCRGDSERAFELFRPLLTDSLSIGDESDTGLLLLWGARAAADIAELARDRRDAEAEQEAIRQLDELLALVQATPPARPGLSVGAHPIWSAYRAMTVAETSRCLGSAGQSVAWEQAASSCQAIGFRWFEAVALWRLAQALLSQGAARSLVAEPLRQAHSTAVELGAVPLVEETLLLATVARISLDEPDVPLQQNQPDLPAPLAALTGREREVLSHLVAGRTNAEIARDLFISDKTVSVHVTNVLRKTGTANRIEAAALARRLGQS